jgi:CheY-like chemotaxis protein
VTHLSPRAALGAGLVVLVFCHGPAFGQPPPKKDGAAAEMNKLLLKATEEYRLFFKQPKTVPEFWAAINFEIDVGKFDVAGLLVGQLLKLPADKVDPDLVRIEEAEGMSAFLRLAKVQRWHKSDTLEKQAQKNVETLINRVTTAVEKRLSDPERITNLINGLSAPTPEERAYAFTQLDRTRERATPYLVDALRRSAGTPEHERLKQYMLKLAPETLPPTFEILRARGPADTRDVDLRLALLYLIKQRHETRAVPYLWHLSAAPRYPRVVRDAAAETLASLLETEPEKLPPAKAALTHLAEQFYLHQFKFDTRGTRTGVVKPPAKGSPEKIETKVVAWRWDGKELARKPIELTRSQAEEYYGLLFADQALDLDPAYKPAQEVFLGLTLERAFAPALDGVLTRKLPDSLFHLLATVDADLLMTALERALTDRNVAVALPLIRALGERGEYRAARPSGEGSPRGLLRALYYPDRRVQSAAVKAYLRLGTPPEPTTSGRVVEILRRFLAAETAPKALVAFAPADRHKDFRAALKGAGFETAFANNTREALEKLRATADYDVILIDQAVPASELPFVLSQLRADSDVGLLPVLILAAPARTASLTRADLRHANVWVVPDNLAAKAGEFKGKIEEVIKLALAPAGIARLPEAQRRWLLEDLAQSSGQKLSAKERQQFAAEAMQYLWEMAKGDLKGYDIRPAVQDVVQAIRSPELAPQALEILGRLPGLTAQVRLADTALSDDPAWAKLRVPAARELNRNIRANGLSLDRNQLKAVQRVYDNPKTDADLRAELALVLSQRQVGSRLTGQRLRDYSPAPPPKK